ncbi:hypothetical protein [Burkholderia pseudomallei]|uniref:hypothetical protein n=1 Tax=Burkholderia pseudomallei TaxID=28450 RepID=UPI001E4A9D83|nr:hypothetical protein [Burkholderia pseudomallei]
MKRAMPRRDHISSSRFRDERQYGLLIARARRVAACLSVVCRGGRFARKPALRQAVLPTLRANDRGPRHAARRARAGAHEARGPRGSRRGRARAQRRAGTALRDRWPAAGRVGRRRGRFVPIPRKPAERAARRFFGIACTPARSADPRRRKTAVIVRASGSPEIGAAHRARIDASGTRAARARRAQTRAAPTTPPRHRAPRPDRTRRANGNA